LTVRMVMHVRQLAKGTKLVLGMAVARQRECACVSPGFRGLGVISVSRGSKVVNAWKYVIGKLRAGGMGDVLMISKQIVLIASVPMVGLAPTVRYML
jgi:hypothetical protein